MFLIEIESFQTNCSRYNVFHLISCDLKCQFIQLLLILKTFSSRIFAVVYCYDFYTKTSENTQKKFIPCSVLSCHTTNCSLHATPDIACRGTV